MKKCESAIAFTSAYLNGCSDFIDFIDFQQTIQAFNGFTIPELESDILVDLLKIFMSGSIKKQKSVINLPGKSDT